MQKQEKAISIFAKRLHELRKDRGWSQPELGEKIGTSGKIIGRYELGYITPSIEVARKLADVFEVTLDYLISGHDMPEILRDRDMIARWRNLEEIPPVDKERILDFVDVMIRDVKTREAYKVGS